MEITVCFSCKTTARLKWHNICKDVSWTPLPTPLSSPFLSTSLDKDLLPFLSPRKAQIKWVAQRRQPWDGWKQCAQGVAGGWDQEIGWVPHCQRREVLMCKQESRKTMCRCNGAQGSVDRRHSEHGAQRYRCTCLCVCVYTYVHRFHTLKPAPNVTVSGGGAFGRRLAHEGGTLTNGILALIWGNPHSSLVPPVGEDTVRSL